MNPIQILVREAHRRSLWQVLGVYLALSWGVYQVVKELTDLFGLPDWVPGFGIVLLLIGLPIVLATAFIQQGAPRLRDVLAEPTDPTLMPMNSTSPVTSPAPARHHVLFTWQKAVLGGICAFLLLGITAGGYMGMRNAGIGPFGSLLASGELNAREPILIADFEPLNNDTMLATTVTEAFRVDFTQSPSVTVVEPKHVRTVLQRMSRDVKSRVDADLAHEVAVRDNIKTYLTGEVSQAGSKYIVSAKLIATKDGRVLASYRETASGEDEIITAVDALSKKMRSKIGESLRTIRAEKPLELVSTPSLDALHKYTGGVYAIDTEGDFETGISLLQEAIQLDTAFAMAWRKLAVAYSNSGRGRELRARAIAKAYDFRDRLTDRERYEAIGMYYYDLKEDNAKAVNAYEMLAQRDPSWPPNNLGILYVRMRNYPKAIATYERAIAIDSLLAQPYMNVVEAHVANNDFKAAEKAHERLRTRFPQHPGIAGLRVFMAAGKLDYDQVGALTAKLDVNDPSLVWRARAFYMQSNVAAVRGRTREAVRLREAATAADVERGNTFAPLLAQLIRAEAALIGERDPVKSAAILERAEADYPLEKYPLLDRPYLWLAESFALVGDRERAERYYALYLDNVPDELRNAHHRTRDIIDGAAAFHAKQHDVALAKWRKVIDTDPCTVCGDPLVALAFEQAGARDSAIARYEHYVKTPWPRRLGIDGVALGSAYERLAELYNAKGDRQNAALYAGKFVELWQNADPELQPRVQAKRELLRTLTSR